MGLQNYSFHAHPLKNQGNKASVSSAIETVEKGLNALSEKVNQMLSFHGNTNANLLDAQARLDDCKKTMGQNNHTNAYKK